MILTLDSIYQDTGEYPREKYADTHLKVFQATKNFNTTCVFAGSGVGKTEMSCVMHVYHATGLYPDWWNGVKYTPGQSTRPGSPAEYSELDLLLVSPQISTIKDVILPKLLGSKWNKSKDPKDVGTGLIRSECFQTDKKGIPMLKNNEQDNYVDRILVTHSRTNTTSTIHLNAYSQGVDEIFIGDFNFTTLDDTPEQKFISEAAKRPTYLFHDARIVCMLRWVATQDLPPYLEKMIKKPEIVETNDNGEKVYCRKTIKISARQVPHMSEEMILQMEGGISSHWMKHAYTHGYPPRNQDQ